MYFATKDCCPLVDSLALTKKHMQALSWPVEYMAWHRLGRLPRKVLPDFDSARLTKRWMRWARRTEDLQSNQSKSANARQVACVARTDHIKGRQRHTGLGSLNDFDHWLAH